MIQLIQKQGLKMVLPLLLLATACDDGAPAAFQLQNSDIVSADGAVTEVKVDEADMQLPSLTEMLPTAEATVSSSDDGDTSLNESPVAISTALTSESAAKVPEPMTLAGLAIVGLGLGVVKRKQAA